MRTSLIEIQEIERWLLNRGDVSDRLLMEAKMLISADLRDKVKWQSYSCDLVNAYGREKLIHEIKAIEHMLFSSSKHRSFQERIRSIFK